jgi:hypothetical protein
MEEGFVEAVLAEDVAGATIDVGGKDVRTQGVESRLLGFEHNAVEAANLGARGSEVLFVLSFVEVALA